MGVRETTGLGVRVFVCAETEDTGTWLIELFARTIGLTVC